MNLVIALACAVEPLAVRVCLPPQSTLAPAVYGRLAGELLQAETSMAPAARAPTTERLRFTRRQLPRRINRQTKSG
ncbi:hypothetical protein MYCO108962_15025 [Mycobacterium colombiense]